MSARTPEAQKVVSGDTNFCINNPSTFWSYGEGAIQVNIINGNLPKANSDEQAEIYKHLALNLFMDERLDE